MCERSNHGLCWLQRKSWHCGYTRVMAVLLGLMHCWRWSDGAANLTFRFVNRSGGISANCQRDISHNKTSGPRRILYFGEAILSRIELFRAAVARAANQESHGPLAFAACWQRVAYPKCTRLGLKENADWISSAVRRGEVVPGTGDRRGTPRRADRSL
jgi:hypothetical protein